ncbi:MULTISPECIES: MFS transporter [Streptomyces]|uniref:MFS transporter permease n=1 Tax=Streptomyces viridochromogenes TaxID=1938 RepID=A0A0L8JW71_STRVR|nr:MULTISPECIES: MFS transporter [Streptomyces]KOG17893.1 MFS transporter permease [Streptomyces viridochromogenes]
MTTTTEARTALGNTPGVRARPAFLLLGGVQMTLIFTLASLAVPLPRIGAAFRLDRAELILLSAAYGLTFAGLLLLGGRLADRFGGRRTLTVGLLVFGAASVAAPLAPGYEALLAARFGQGVGAALVAPAAMALLRALFPEPAAYGRAMATWGGLSVLGATAGNLLSGVIAAVSSWRGTFAVPVAVTLAALLLAPGLLPTTSPGPGRPLRQPGTSRSPDRPGTSRYPDRPGTGRPLRRPGTGRSLDLPGALLATAGITLASYGLVLTDAHPWASAPVLVPLSTGLVLLAAFGAVERRTADPLLPPDFLRDGRRALGLAAIGLTAAGTATVFVLLSLTLQQQRGWSALLTSAAFVPFAVALLGAGRFAGPLIGRYGPGRVTGAGLGTAAAGLGLLAATGFETSVPYAYGLLPGLLLLPAGGALSFAGAAVLATWGVPAHHAGLAGGVLNTAMELGPTVVFAALLTLGGDAVSLATAAALFAALAAVTVLAPLMNRATRATRAG